MVLKENLDEYDEYSVFICWRCEKSPYRILRKFDLVPAKNDEEVCRFCNGHVEDFKFSAECINEYKKIINYFKKKSCQIDIPKLEKSKIISMKKIIMELQEKR